MNRIVLLSGPVGAGKSTVTRELVALSPGPIASIEGDLFWSFIAKGAGKGRHADFRTILRAMTAAAVPYALSGYEAIVDFSIPPWFLETAVKITEPRGITLDYVVIRPSEAVCAARAAARPEGTIPDYAPYSELYSSFDEAERYLLSDDTADAGALAARIRAGLDAGDYRIP